MIPRRSPNPEEITNLLSKLKDGTPEYPADILEARKTAFLKQAGTISIQGKGPGGQPGGNGGSGATPGGGLTGPGFLMRALIGLGLIVALLTAVFVYREQITDLLAGNDNGVVSVEQTPIPSGVSTVTPLATPSLPPTITSTPVPPTGTATGFPTTANGTPVIAAGTPDDTQGNNGLHLGQTPGTPAAPGQGNPGNPNQPDKPPKDKPEKNKGNPKKP